MAMYSPLRLQRTFRGRGYDLLDTQQSSCLSAPLDRVTILLPGLQSDRGTANAYSIILYIVYTRYSGTIPMISTVYEIHC